MQRGVADDAAGWECFVNLRHHQRGSDQPFLSPAQIVFDNGQQALNHDSRRSSDLRLTVIGGLPPHGVLRLRCARHVIHRKA